MLNENSSLKSGFWHGEAGIVEILRIAFPLILSTSAWTIQQTVDRLFLTWYSPEAIAAALPSGLVNFTIMSVFIGTAGYVSTFVAQYHGAGHPKRIGSALWQSIYFSLLGGLIVMACTPLARPIFNSLGHDPNVVKNEIIYFQVLCLGSIPPILNSALSGFFSGLGKTWPLMWANFLGTAVNIVLDYILIFGKFGFPEMGIFGAAIATVIAGFSSFLYYALLIFTQENEKKYQVISDRKFKPDIFRRILYFGFPSGIQFFLDIIGISIFLLFVGRFGIASLAASNIAFTINTIAFMPMIGIGFAVSILVGQYLGANNVTMAVKAVRTSFILTFTYMTIIALLYWTIPGVFLHPFSTGANPGDFNEISRIATVLLKFIAIYCLFDSMTIIFISALKGAGDTLFVMVIAGVMSIFGLIIPSYLVMVKYQLGIYPGWAVCTAYISILGIAFFLRYLTGKWKHMRVIEPNLVMFPSSPNPNIPHCAE